MAAIPVDDMALCGGGEETMWWRRAWMRSEMSTDGGKTWQAVALPPKVTQVSALSVDGQGEVWVGDRDGVYFRPTRARTGRR